MSAILSTFGIDWHLLLIQGVNFGILVAGLTYFLYKPVTRMLEERRAHVEAGVAASTRAQEHLGEIEASRGEVLARAGREADEVLSAARASATAKEREILAHGEATAAAAVREARAQAAELKERAIQESKQDLAKLVVLGVEKTLRQGSGQTLQTK